MDFEKIYEQTSANRRQSFLIMKNDKILSSLDDQANTLKDSIEKFTIDGHRQRSFSAGCVPSSSKQTRLKIPNFKKTHEMQFDKMESIQDYAIRKAERAKTLLSPPRLMRRTSPIPRQEVPNSKLPILKRSLSINYKNLESVPSKKFKAETEKTVSKIPTLQPETSQPKPRIEQRNSLSLATSWLKNVKLNRRFQLLMMSHQKKI